MTVDMNLYSFIAGILIGGWLSIVLFWFSEHYQRLLEKHRGNRYSKKKNETV